MRVDAYIYRFGAIAAGGGVGAVLGEVIEMRALAETDGYVPFLTAALVAMLMLPAAALFAYGARGEAWTWAAAVASACYVAFVFTVSSGGGFEAMGFLAGPILAGAAAAVVAGIRWVLDVRVARHRGGSSPH